MAELVLNTVLGSDGSSVTTTNDDNLAVLGGVDGSVECSLGAIGELLELEDTSWSVPEDGLGLVDGLLVKLDGLLAAVQSLPAIWDTGLVGGGAGVGVWAKLVGGDVVDWEHDLDVVLLGLLDQVGDGLGAGLVEEGLADLNTVEGLLEGEGHATADDQGVDLVEEVVDQLDLVGDLGTAEDGKEWSLWVLKGLREVLELLLHEETGGLLWEVDTDHRAVRTVGSSEGVVCLSILACSPEILADSVRRTDVDVTQSGETLPELLNIGLVCLDLLALSVLAGTLLLGVEAQVLEENNAAVGDAVDSLLNLWADTVLGEGDLGVEELLELGNDWLQGVLWVDLAVWAAQVGHEDHGLCAILTSVLDGRKSTNNALVVGDVLVGVKWDVEVDLSIYISSCCFEGKRPLRAKRCAYTDEDALALEVDVSDGELVGERHDDCNKRRISERTFADSYGLQSPVHDLPEWVGYM